MFQDSIKQGKPEPDFRGTDEHQVCVTLSGDVQDARFLKFVEAIANERQRSFSTTDLVVLDRVAREQPLWPGLKERLPALVAEGLIERVGRGKGLRYIVSQRFQRFLGRRGEYTRKRGLDTETQKALLLQHIERSNVDGCQFKELHDVLPNLSRDQVQARLRELKSEGKAHPVGVTKNARWFPGPGAAEGASAGHRIASTASRKTQS
jgi:ATP-dependent DNA helicase RecG